MPQLSWNRSEDGVITVYARSTDGRLADVADFWLRPLIERFGMERAAALEWQQQFAELLVNSHNRLFVKTESDGGFAMQAPPPGLDSTPPDGAGVEWTCPINRQDCQENCGNYGCGN